MRLGYLIIMVAMGLVTACGTSTNGAKALPKFDSGGYAISRMPVPGDCRKLADADGSTLYRSFPDTLSGNIVADGRQACCGQRRQW